MMHTETLELDGQNQITLSHTPVAGTISIPYEWTPQEEENGTVTRAGMMEETAQEVTKGHFKVTGSKVTFYPNDVGSKVEVSYYYQETVREANIDNRSSAMGEAIMQWPVYGNGDDCTDAAIIGYVTVKVYRARVTAQPGFDSSYKTANTLNYYSVA